MPFKTFTSTVLSSSDVNTYLMKQANITCTSGTRPASPVEGMMIYETDTDLIAIYDGAAWGYVGGMTAYTPSVTGWSLGNGTTSGYWGVVGKLISYTAVVTAGSTTTFGATLSLSLPATPSGSLPTEMPIGTAYLTDVSAGAHLLGLARVSSGAAQVVYNNAAATNIVGASGSNPWAWTTGDSVIIFGSYWKS